MTTELAATTTTSSPKNNATKKSKAKTTTKSERKKKHVNKKSSAASTGALYSAARLQYHKLLKRRDAELNDRVWLSNEPLPFQNRRVEKLNGSANPFTAAEASLTATTTTATDIGSTIKSPSFLEQDVEIVYRALFRNGLNLGDVTIDAFDALLEEARKYAMELITDAADCAAYSHGNDIITPADLVLAKEMETDEGCFALENMEEISKKSKEINKIALPPIPDNCYNGIVLPDLEHTLLNRAFDVVCRRDDDLPMEHENKISSTGSKKDAKNLQSMLGSVGGLRSGRNMKENEMSAYGAKRVSKQMQILLKKSQTEQQGQPAPSSSSQSSLVSNEKSGVKEVNVSAGATAATKGGLQESVVPTTTTTTTTTSSTSSSIIINDSHTIKDKSTNSNHSVMKTESNDQVVSSQEPLETLPDADFMDLS
jgi:hypothetical protein